MTKKRLYATTEMRSILKKLPVIVPGIVVLLFLFSGVWNYIVKSRSPTILSQAALDATQEALTEKAAYQAAEYRTKRLQKEAQSQYELEKIRLKIKMLPGYTTLKFYSLVGGLAIVGLSLIILSSGYAGAKIRQASVWFARIGAHSEIPVHYSDLQSFYPIAVNLSLAEIQASISTSHENAYQISRRMIEDITNYTRAIAGKRGLLSVGSGRPGFSSSLLSAGTSTPTFADLLRDGIAAPGKPLVLGCNQGQPQYRSLKDLKSLAVAGWQGSGKTLSMAYIVASGILADGVHAYIIDPHKNHEEGLYSLIQPLEKTGHVTVINPFDTPALINDLNNTLDRRLDGREANTSGILLVIDELARLAKMDCFDVLLAFLERCTEETRKANMTFIGSSHKWTARHFSGRADIRGSMNSMLIHKTKPSQADLLLEDTHDKNLVRQLQRPGDAILVTDYDNPTVVSMPLCTRGDMEIVAGMLGATGENVIMNTSWAAASGVPPLATYYSGNQSLFNQKTGYLQKGIKNY